MTESKAAFNFNLDRLFADRQTAYFWTFTFPDLPDFPEVRERWRKLVNWLKRAFQDTVHGVRVYEIHETHGIHLHAIFNRRVPVQVLRPAAKRYGFGRIHVKRVSRAGAGYLAKYLGKQHRTEWLQGQRLWAAFGNFKKCRVKDVEVESNFTRAVQFCKAELGLVKLPFKLTRLLMQWATDNPAQLKKACAIYRTFGLWEAALIKALTEDDFSLARWFQENPNPSPPPSSPPTGGED